MNEETFTLSELLDGFYLRKITKATVLRTLENFYDKNFVKIVTYSDSYYYGLVSLEELLKVKKCIYKPEKFIHKDTTRVVLLRKNIENKSKSVEIVVSLFIAKNNFLKIDTEIFEMKKNGIKSYWFSQIENYEDYLRESNDLCMRKIDGMILDLKEKRNEALLLPSNTKPKILKRFSKLDFD